jgi:hypothetical protein
LSKIKNYIETHQNSLKNGKLFLILLNFGWVVDLAMSIFEFFDTPDTHGCASAVFAENEI